MKLLKHQFDRETKTEPLTSATLAVAVVSGGHHSARAGFRLDRKSPAIRPCVSFLRVCLESTRESGKNAVQKMEAFWR